LLAVVAVANEVVYTLFGLKYVDFFAYTFELEAVCMFFLALSS